MSDINIVKVLDRYFQTMEEEAQKKGKDYLKNNQVQIEKLHHSSIQAKVLDSINKSYQVHVKIENQTVFSSCSCSMHFDCEHVAATILALTVSLENPAEKNSELITQNSSLLLSPQTINDPSVKSWINSFLKNPSIETPKKISSDQRCLAFYFTFETRSSTILLSLMSCKIKKDGGISKNHPTEIHFKNLWDYSMRAVRESLTEDDWELIQFFVKTTNFHSTPHISFNFPNSGIILKRLIETGRSFIKGHDMSALQWGPPQTGQFQWDIVLEKDAQQLKFIMGHPGTTLLKDLSPPCYFNKEANTMGWIHFQEEQETVQQLFNAPLIRNSEVQQVHKLLSNKIPFLSGIRPKQIKEILLKYQPKPHLKLFLAKLPNPAPAYYRKWMNEPDTIELLAATISFNYGSYTFSFTDSKNKEIVETFLKSETEFIKIPRELDKERFYISQLSKLHWSSQPKKTQQNGFYFTYEGSDDQDLIEAAALILNYHVPILKNLDWTIEIDPSFPIQGIFEGEEWYLDAEETGGMQDDWFDVKLGVLIDGERVNMLPALIQFINNLSKKEKWEEFESLPDQEMIPLLTDDGKMIMVPIERIRAIAEHLLVEFAHGGKDSLHLSKWNAAFLQEFALGEAAAKTRWMGSSKLSSFASIIRENASVHQDIIPPASLKCELRPYQKQGLNWMQFLRRCQMNGILADEMGLGKTVQTLAHLLIEKEDGRMTLPAIVIAPTSLMPNWFNEAARLAPSLKVLVLHGTERKLHFSKINEFDLILTTYPLLMRDKEFLISQQFHLMILDEAQTIKNYKTQAYQVVQQIHANQRLCLSGTPIENHLGELWSLFHLLLPGFLGDLKAFQSLYRKPIEKQGHQARRESLVKRIKPFILRRTKQQVALELPDKTEIIQKIELKAKQRDLYEAIRLRSQEQVMKQIEKKGLNQSQIIVLDALLKLRQVCCDPRLVKMENAKQVEESAKLECLIEMISQMVEENRKILVFSQFTSMLALISETLRQNKIDYTILTGETKDRDTPVKEFQLGSVPVMLISLKAGGVGLNLTAADTVIHYDPWWNPAVENQATDRAHRIGQKKAVFVYKLIVSGSLEEKIMDLQTRKKGLVSALLDTNTAVGAQLTMEDLESIFQPLPPPI